MVLRLMRVAHPDPKIAYFAKYVKIGDRGSSTLRPFPKSATLSVTPQGRNTKCHTSSGLLT